MRVSVSISGTAALYFATLVLTLVILGSTRGSREPALFRGSQFSDKPCDEIYVVGEGETLQTIGDKCGDPFIVERNPHIHDPDDVFPGLVMKINPNSSPRKLLR